MRVLRLSILALLVPSTALAFRPIDDRRAAIELAGGEVVRPQIDVEHRRVSLPGRWQAMFDRHTGVPVRIWGGGIEAPKSERSPQAAEQFSRAFLAEHLALLAPGASIEDFELVSNVLSN